MLGFATNPTGMGPRGYSSEELRAYFVGWWEVFIRPTTFRAMGGCGTMPAWIRSPVDRTPEAGFKIHLSATDEDADYGKAQFVVLSNEDVSYVGDNFNDKMSSIKVFQGCKCTIYWDAGYNGSTWTFDATSQEIDKPWIGEQWNDQTSGIVCTGP